MTDKEIKELVMGIPTAEKRVKFAICCALEVYDAYSVDGFVKWAKNWLNGKDQSVEVAVEVFWVAARTLRCFFEPEQLAAVEAAEWASKSAASLAARASKWPARTTAAVTKTAEWAQKANPNTDLKKIAQNLRNKHQPG